MNVSAWLKRPSTSLRHMNAAAGSGGDCRYGYGKIGTPAGIVGFDGPVQAAIMNAVLRIGGACTRVIQSGGCISIRPQCISVPGSARHSEGVSKSCACSCKSVPFIRT